MNQKKVAIVNSHPTQYFGPLYRYLNQDPDIDITALYCCDVNIRSSYDDQFKEKIKYDNDMLGGYKSIFLGARSSKRNIGGFWSLMVPEIWNEIRNGRYDIVWIHGYSFFAFILALIAAKKSKSKVFLRGETHLRLKRNFLKESLHKIILKILFRFYDGFFAIGTANKEYYLKMGVPYEKIFLIPYTIDNSYFYNLTKNSSADSIYLDKVNQDIPTILFASKFMKRKNPLLLLESSKLLSKRNIRHNLVFVGSGEMENEMRNFIRQNDLKNVFLEGFINQSLLPKIYSESDIFVLPSVNEPWGLIVNEVMAAGMPVVVSSEVGCVDDLIKHGVNGFKFEAGNSEELSNYLAKLISDKDLIKEMGLASQTIISRWSYEECRVGLSNALKSSLN